MLEAYNGKKLLRIFLFSGMFLLATGSVCISCASAPKGSRTKHEISLNIGKTQDGKMYTTSVLTDIQSVLLVNGHDHSKKTELQAGEWQYNPETTELKITAPIPFDDYIASVKGDALFPYTFVLTGMSDRNSLMVILDNRLAIEGYDYTFHADTNRLVLRDDIEINDREWNIQYQSAKGSASLGEWKPENQDRMSYLEAEHRKRYLDSWYDSQDTFWFFAEPTQKDRKPELIKREATPQELAQMKNTPIPVLKFRMKATERSLSRELGYKVSFPKKISLPDYSAEYRAHMETIEESADNGTLARKLSVFYELLTPVSSTGLPRQMDLYILPAGETPDTDSQEKNMVISTDTINLGIPVTRIRRWAMYTENMTDRPEIRSCTEWFWQTPESGYYLVADSSNDSVYEAVIRRIIQR